MEFSEVMLINVHKSALCKQEQLVLRVFFYINSKSNKLICLTLCSIYSNLNFFPNSLSANFHASLFRSKRPNYCLPFLM